MKRTKVLGPSNPAPIPPASWCQVTHMQIDRKPSGIKHATPHSKQTRLEIVDLANYVFSLTNLQWKHFCMYSRACKWIIAKLVARIQYYCFVRTQVELDL